MPSGSPSDRRHSARCRALSDNIALLGSDMLIFAHAAHRERATRRADSRLAADPRHFAASGLPATYPSLAWKRGARPLHEPASGNVKQRPATRSWAHPSQERALRDLLTAIGLSASLRGAH